MDLIVIPPILRNKTDSVEVNAVLFGENPVDIDNFSIEIIDPSVFPTQTKKLYINDYQTITIGNWSKPQQLIGKKGYEIINAQSPFSSTLNLKSVEFKNKETATLNATVNLQNNYSDTYLVLSIESEGKDIFYKSFPLVKNKEGWQNFEISINLPK